MRDRRLTMLLTALMLLGIPVVAWASRTPYYEFHGMNHLLFGNAGIGMVEGMIIGTIFRIDTRKTIPVMIWANYVSSIIAYIVFSLIWERLPIEASATIYSASTIISLSVLALLVLDIILAWPFFYGVLRKQRKAGRLSVLTCVAMQSVLCLVLVVLYGGCCNVSLLTYFHPTRDLSFASGSKAVVYYISTADKAVYKVRPDGTERSRVGAPGSALLMLTESQRHGYSDLFAFDGKKETLICDAVDKDGEHGPWDGFSHYHRPHDLRPNDQRHLEVLPQQYGIWLRDVHTGRDIRPGVETPFLVWGAVYINVLPGDILVFQTHKQVLVLDVNRRKVGLLAMGESPVAVVPDLRQGDGAKR